MGKFSGLIFFCTESRDSFWNFIRDDPGRGSVFGGVLSGTQLIAIGLVLTGGLIWYLRPTPKALLVTATR